MGTLDFIMNNNSVTLLISVLSLFVSICSTFYYTRKSNRLSAQTRVTDLIDKIYVLGIEKDNLKRKKVLILIGFQMCNYR